MIITASAFSADKKVEKVKIITSMGDIELELYREKAPLTVANFLSYVDENFYENTIFHRVINGFMIQGGGFTKGMNKKNAPRKVKNEAQTGLSNDVGTIAMARTSDPHSASSQFFINVGNNYNLNFSAPTQSGYGYTAFGRVTKGMPVVNMIKGIKTTRNGPYSDVPVNDVVIKKITRI